MSFAVIKTGGKQYLVKPKDKVKVEKLKIADGKEVHFDEVLLTADTKASDVKIGNPVIKQAMVTAKILGQGKTKKVTGYHYKAKTRNKKKFGHRQAYTEVEITAVKA